MAFENNRPANFSDVALAGRDISARRAATIANMVDEAAARGLDDEFARAAISPGNRAALSNVTDNIPMPPKNSKDFREAEMPRKSLFIGLFACPGSYAHVSAALMSFL